MTNTKPPNLDEIFTRPTVPKNSWQLIQWLIFEPELVRNYEKTLTKKQQFFVLLKTYGWFALFVVLLYLLVSAVTLVVGLASNLAFGLAAGFFCCLVGRLVGIDGGLVIGLSVGLIYGIAYGFALGLIEGLASGLPLGLTVGLAFNFAGGPAANLANGPTLNLAGGLIHLAIDLVGFLVAGLFFGFVGGLAVGLTKGFDFGIVFGLIFGLSVSFGSYIGYFRLIFYPFYYLSRINFDHSPYHNNSRIWLPIWRAKQRLCDLAMETPETAMAFATFLRNYRPLQSKLADYIVHAAFAGMWLQNPLQADAIPVRRPAFIENDALKPSTDWLEHLKRLRAQLTSYQQQSNLQLKQKEGQLLLNELESFKQQTLIENRNWRDYYLKALEQWLKVANEELENLKRQAQSQEPITANVYLAGKALNPDLNQAVFLGREDLKEQFARQVLTATEMPLFLIQGQRRTGKTSLLNFLEPLLGAGFKVIKQDLQSGNLTSIPLWLTDLQQRICQHLAIPTPAQPMSDNWLECWQALQATLENFNGRGDYKLILAFDEYEAIHQMLQKDCETGERLLAAMRSFSQSQNKVVFLFVGAALFTELKNPNWSRYFVQVERFRVDYLKHDDAIRLITEPVNLNYPPELCEQMFELTQGHPALLQLLCSKMVDIANQVKRSKDMTQADLDKVINDVSNEMQLNPLVVFWQDFCEDPECKLTVKRILNGETVEPNPHFYRLEEHGFIVEKDGKWQLRVPLFAMWLKRFADRVA